MYCEQFIHVKKKCLYIVIFSQQESLWWCMPIIWSWIEPSIHLTFFLDNSFHFNGMYVTTHTHTHTSLYCTSITSQLMRDSWRESKIRFWSSSQKRLKLICLSHTLIAYWIFRREMMLFQKNKSKITNKINVNYGINKCHKISVWTTIFILYLWKYNESIGVSCCWLRNMLPSNHFMESIHVKHY